VTACELSTTSGRQLSTVRHPLLCCKCCVRYVGFLVNSFIG
jgi:hypothetical protein